MESTIIIIIKKDEPSFRSQLFRREPEIPLLPGQLKIFNLFSQPFFIKIFYYYYLSIDLFGSIHLFMYLLIALEKMISRLKFKVNIFPRKTREHRNSRQRKQSIQMHRDIKWYGGRPGVMSNNLKRLGKSLDLICLKMRATEGFREREMRFSLFL